MRSFLSPDVGLCSYDGLRERFPLYRSDVKRGGIYSYGALPGPVRSKLRGWSAYSTGTYVTSDLKRSS
jgi:hypothetical protein